MIRHGFGEKPKWSRMSRLCGRPTTFTPPVMTNRMPTTMASAVMPR